MFSKGYFPYEVPPSFTTRDFASCALSNLPSLGAAARTKHKSKLCKYSLARASSKFRRTLGIPNPLHYIPLCETIVTNWTAISALFATSSICKSTPVRHAHKARAVSPKYAQHGTHPFRADVRAGGRAIVRADIAEFYGSLYTHSIPWACHSKAVAKATRGIHLFGNNLDKLLRACQDQQTLGVPIGPDTSFIVAEILLAACDNALQTRTPAIVGTRWIDEFELVARDRGDAEKTLANLQQVLSEYELRINPRKTGIFDLPIEFDRTWIGELRAFQFRSPAVAQANDLIRYFDYITAYLGQNPNEHVVKYGLARIRTLNPHSANQTLFQSLICQAATAEPGAIREAFECLHYCETHHHAPADRGLLERVINAVAEHCATIGHHFEVSWCLWAAINWQIPLHASAANAISTLSNSVVAILALDARQRGLFTTPLNTAVWEARMTQNDLYEEEWLLAYEANVQGWLPSIGAADHVAADPGFSILKSGGVKFYQPSSSPFTPGGLAYP